METDKAAIADAAAKASAAADDHDDSIQTYHCVCSQLLLGMSTSIESLPQRAAPAQDRARILPLRPSRSGKNNGDDDDENNNNNNNHGDDDDGQDGSSLPLVEITGLVQDRIPIMVERADGYEKRWQWRCLRCNLMGAYALKNDVVGAGGVLYLFDRCFRTTEDMLKGKKV